MDSEGNLYGTTKYGGDNGYGVVFKLTRAADSWTYSVLYSFKGSRDGYYPLGPLAIEAAWPYSVLYGSAGGGEFGCGIVYKLIPYYSGSDKITVHSFECPKEGGPNPGVTVDSKGNLYGTTATGGDLEACPSNGGCGTVFKLEPTADDTGYGTWKYKVLKTFHNKTDGFYPASRVVFDGAGNLYGSTLGGGYKGWGTVFQLSPMPTTGELRMYRLLHYFHLTYDGAEPGEIIVDTNGNAYGMTSAGGGDGNASGTIYQLTPTVRGRWKFNLLYTLVNGGAWNQLALGTYGKLYGTAAIDQAGTQGVFKLSPTASGTWTWTTLYRFVNSDTGYSPNGILLDKNRPLYGVTEKGGLYNSGIIYKLNR